MTPYLQLHNMGLKVLIIFGFKATRTNYWHHTSNATGFYNPANELANSAQRLPTNPVQYPKYDVRR